MTPLAPLYLLGALAIAGPILFHLWRRTPRGRREFSTLMFLSPSPPRVTSRSRIEHWLLLLLRGAVLGLLALTFARPLWRTAVSQPEAAQDQELVAILVDTSASLRRDQAWTDLVTKLISYLSSLPPTATVGLFQFNDRWSEVAGFRELKLEDSTARRQIVKDRLTNLKPTWGGTNLGNALAETAAALQEIQAERSLPARLRIVLASDFQSGARLDALHGFEWPVDCRVEPLFARVDSPSNAGLQLVERNPELADDALRVRVSNSADSRKDRFQLKWSSDQSEVLSVYVPPGQSRVVVPPRRPVADQATSLKLTGDDHDFDNTIHIAPPSDETKSVVYCGSGKEDDPQGLRFYLEGVFAASPRYTIAMQRWQEALPTLKSNRPALVVLVEPESGAGDFVRSYLASGGTVLIAAPSVSAGMDALNQCGLAGISLTEAAVTRDVMLGDIDFKHQLFAPFAESQFSDFTGIRYWKHRTLSGLTSSNGSPKEGSATDGRVLARFDDGDPAFIEFPMPRGRVWVMTAGWHPADSQLARSSKFPPLAFRMLEQASGAEPRASCVDVAAEISWPGTTSTLEARGNVRRPDGRELTDQSTQNPFTGTDTPGLYTLEVDGQAEVVAVNLVPDESRTQPLPIEQLESLGVKFGAVETPEDIQRSHDRQRQLQIEELEQNQKLWRWGILLVVVLLIAETWIAGRRGTPPSNEPAE